MKNVVYSLLALGFFVSIGLVAFNQNNKNNPGPSERANLFNGTAWDYCMEYVYGNEYNCEIFYGYRKNDKVIMKWSKEYDKGEKENWSNPPYYDSWIIESWNGNVKDGSGWREYWKWGWDEGCALNHTPSMGGAAYCWGSSPFVILMHSTKTPYSPYLYWDWKKIDGKWYMQALPAGVGNL